MFYEYYTKTQLINIIIQYDATWCDCIGKLYSKPKDYLIKMVRRYRKEKEKINLEQ